MSAPAPTDERPAPPAGPLLCPLCRRPDARPPVAAPLAETARGALLAGANPAGGAVFPVLDGVPVVLRDLAGWLAHQAAVATAPLAGDAAWDTVLAWLPPADPLRQSREALAAAAAGALASWLPAGAAPTTDEGSAAAPCAGAALARWLAAWVPPSARTAVDLGCGVGAAALTLAERGLDVVALDLLLAPLRVLRRLRDEGQVAVPLRTGGSRYRTAPCALPGGPLAGRAGAGRLTVVVADALAPPLAAEAFDVVHAGAVLDNVADPLFLLGQADALLRPGGRLLLTSAAAWRPDITPEGCWLGTTGRGGPDAPGPEELLRAALTGRHPALPHLAYDLLEDRPGLRWTVPRDDRCAVTYDLHAVVARKR
jgi:SAM-dependent methyltransferase